MPKDADSQDVNVNSVMINTTTIIGIVQVSKTCKGSDLDTKKIGTIKFCGSSVENNKIETG